MIIKADLSLRTITLDGRTLAGKAEVEFRTGTTIEIELRGSAVTEILAILEKESKEAVTELQKELTPNAD